MVVTLGKNGEAMCLFLSFFLLLLLMLCPRLVDDLMMGLTFFALHVNHEGEGIADRNGSRSPATRGPKATSDFHLTLGWIDREDHWTPGVDPASGKDKKQKRR